ncbi:MAG: hypothetical protein WKF97_02725 [Chitinophagaceae bacterium]
MKHFKDFLIKLQTLDIQVRQGKMGGLARNRKPLIMISAMKAPFSTHRSKTS